MRTAGLWFVLFVLGPVIFVAATVYDAWVEVWQWLTKRWR
jgi:hypothetical protein